MAVKMLCPNLSCRRFLSVSDDLRGKIVKCQQCQAAFRVPTAAKPKPAAPAPAVK